MNLDHFSPDPGEDNGMDPEDRDGILADDDENDDLVDPDAGAEEGHGTEPEDEE